MRQWKIRTKMIAGLAMLAVVIGVLVYSSWSQLARDRNLATQISQLADEIHYAYKLNRWSERLGRWHMQFQALMPANDQMIEADRMMALDEVERSALRSESHYSILYSFYKLGNVLDNYQGVLAEHGQTREATPFLVDRQGQRDSLQQINALLDQSRAAWEEATGPEWEEAGNPESGVIAQQMHQELQEDLDRLVELTHGHFDAIQRGMKEFRDRVRSEQKAKRHSFWLFTSLSGFLILFLAWQFWTLIVVPFRTLFRGSQLIAAGHRHHKILLGTNDEIGSMADTVNHITERFNRAVAEVTLAKQRAEQEVRDRTREVIQNEQLASVGFLAAGVAHEINNPLGAIAWSAEALEETLAELQGACPRDAPQAWPPEVIEEFQTNLQLIQSEAFRCKGITKRLLHFSRLSDSSRASEDVGELVQRVVAMVAKVGEYRCKTVRTHVDEEVHAYCNAQEIQQVVLNLVSNALESVDRDGQVDVLVRKEVDGLNGVEQAVVVVEDNGCGMTQEVMAHLFEPFFTRRRDNTGTGLGLSISYRIVSLHHGSLTPYSDGEGCGSKMVLRLPAEPPRDELQPVPAAAAATPFHAPSTTWNDVQKVA